MKDEEKTIPTEGRAVAESKLFWTGYDVAVLGEEQGIHPVRSLDDLWGDFWPEDECVDDFIEAVRHWRQGKIEA